MNLIIEAYGGVLGDPIIIYDNNKAKEIFLKILNKNDIDIPLSIKELSKDQIYSYINDNDLLGDYDCYWYDDNSIKIIK